MQEIVQAALRSLTDVSLRWDGPTLAAVLLQEEAVALMTDQALQSARRDEWEHVDEEPIVPSVRPMTPPAIGV